jgi:hypothetical protein
LFSVAQIKFENCSSRAGECRFDEKLQQQDWGEEVAVLAIGKHTEPGSLQHLWKGLKTEHGEGVREISEGVRVEKISGGIAPLFQLHRTRLASEDLFIEEESR